MFGMGWAEMMIVGVVALIVVGPKDLPIMFRKLGNAVGKAKGMAREFSRAMNDAADGAGMKDT
ncbi:MAG: Sec-independent protein translocase protein TatB, partial [Planktomarina sp.]